MTDRLNALTVVLDRDIRNDDAKKLIHAIEMLRGVLKVEPHVASIEDAIAIARARNMLSERIWNALHSEKP